MRFLGEFECLGRVFERLPGMLLSRYMIAFFVMYGGGAMSVCGHVVELCSFAV